LDEGLAPVVVWERIEPALRKLDELDEPEPTAGDCGEVLVALEWPGRATVRCDARGARWGVEVISATQSSGWTLDY
jgi:hypothetical protein